MKRLLPLLVMLVLLDRTYGGYEILSRGLTWNQCYAKTAKIRQQIINSPRVRGAIFQVECWEEDQTS
jgi:hypothetical protein